MQGMKHKPHHVSSTSTDDDDDEDMDMDMEDSSATGMGNMDMGSMCSALSVNLPMNHNGSGTSWLPDASPMYGYMLHPGKWMFMFHGDIFARYNRQDIASAGYRGAEKLDAPSMLMAMGQRKIGKKGLFHFNIMLSADALIAGGSGYPLLFQTGETWNGQPLVDRQHPHDLFSELSVSYAYALSKKSDIYIYAGYPGEPALGPVTFMHRTSGMFGPDAPIGHHWADATHITFGVATLGYRYGKFKLEGSSFTGREPDEERLNLDQPKFDSWSGRLSCNPSESWALQVSRGFIKSPETLHPNEDITRTTASATYTYPLTEFNYIGATALFGQNAIANHDASNSALLEATIKLANLAMYARYEWVKKSGEELNLTPLVFNANKLYPINALTVGGSYDIFSLYGITVAGGLQVSAYKADKQLSILYGDNPISGEVFLHLYPKRMR